MSFEKLFSPIKIRELELRNRVVMSATGTHESAASEDGRMVADKLIAYHVARAKGGCGLNTIEVCSVDAASAPTGFLSIADDRYIPGMKKLCSAVHAAGGRVAVQLWQGGLAVASDPQAQILLPSDMPLSPEYTVPGITEERIQSVIEAFGQAARRVVEAAEAAAREGLGVVSLNGKMVDGPVIDRARLVLSRAELSGIREE